jgi:hypothetical protein
LNPFFKKTDLNETDCIIPDKVLPIALLSPPWPTLPFLSDLFYLHLRSYKEIWLAQGDIFRKQEAA